MKLTKEEAYEILEVEVRNMLIRRTAACRAWQGAALS